MRQAELTTPSPSASASARAGAWRENRPAGRWRQLVAWVIIGGLLTACGAVTDAQEVPGALADGPPLAQSDDARGVDAVLADADERTGIASEAPAPVDEVASAPPPSADPPAPPLSRAALVADLEERLDAAHDLAGTDSFTVLVVDEYGREVLSHEHDRPVLPASTLKIVTAAAALTTFGPDARFTTRVKATGALDEHGVLDGDLVLVGSGDPVLSTEAYRRWVYPARPDTPIEDLADAVVAAGLTRVTGDLIGVADGYEGPGVAEGWPERYFNDFDARYADGLTVDAGLRTLVTYPPARTDDDAAPGSEKDADGATTDGDDGDGDDAANEDEATDDAPRDGGVDASTDGQDAADGSTDDVDDADTAVPPASEPNVVVEHAPDPAAHTTNEFARLLAERGVEVAGQPRAADSYGTVVGQLAQVTSPTMTELLRFAVQRSDNQLTDALFRAVGRARTGTGSFESGDRAIRQVLERFSIDHDAATFADGSGLSRDDRVTAELLVELDRAMYTSRHAATWESLMAVTGTSGTLQGRLAGTIADGRFAGKTGTLRDVSGLVGSIAGTGGRRFHLAVVANDPSDARWVARGLADDLILLLVADLDA